MQNIYKILFLDDDTQITNVVSDFFKGSRLDIWACNDPDEAITYLKSNQVDCIITDLKMPKLNGLLFFNKVRDEICVKTPGILLSGDINQEVKEEAKNVGLGAVFEKNLNPSEFEQRIIDFIEQNSMS